MRFFPISRQLPRVMAALLLCASAPALALSCKETGSGNVNQTITLDQPIKVSTGNLQAGTLLWRSQTFTSSFTCTDTDGYPRGEEAYLYWDPKQQMQGIDPSLEIGITYQGVDYKPVKGARLLIGQGTFPADAGCKKNCVAKPNTITVSYSVYIKATGVQPPENGKINSTGAYSMFQVDGVGGLNGRPDSNFNALISGLGFIHFISCNPVISVAANQGNTVEFGRIPAANARSGKVEKSIPFSVVANLSGEGVGGDCEGQALEANFSTTYPLVTNTVIMPAADAGFGIFISQPESSATAIEMKTPVSMGVVTGETSRLEKAFLANLTWLSDKPRIGGFTATANVDVTFK